MSQPINTDFEINWDHPISKGLRGFISASDRLPVERVTNQILAVPSPMDYAVTRQAGRMWKPSTVGVGRFNIKPWDMSQGCLAVWAHSFQSDFTYPCFASYGENNSNNVTMDSRDWEMWPRTDWSGTALQLTDGNPDKAMNSPDAFLYAFSWYGGSGGTGQQIRDGVIADSGTIPDVMTIGTPTDWYLSAGIAFNNLYPMDTGYVGDVYLWDRYVTPQEIKEISNRPWILYKPIVPVFYSIPEQSIDVLTTSDVTSGTPTTDTSSILEATFLRPASDVNAGLWTPSTGTTLYETVDEITPSDVDYMRSDDSPSASPATIGLQPGTDPSESSFHIVRYRYRKSGGGTVNLNFALYEGATVRAQWSHTDVSDTYTTGEYVLSAAEADSITDYTTLRVRVQATEV